MRTRSSWVIRCVRGMTRTLEVRVDDQDEVTELRLDDQQAGAGIEGGRGSSRLTIPLPEPLRPGAERRLVMKTRRSYAGARGVGSRSWDSRSSTPASNPGRSASRRAPTSGWPRRRPRACGGSSPPSCRKELPERPGTSLAFEFLDQPFSLGLDVEASPPLVRSRSRTLVPASTATAPGARRRSSSSGSAAARSRSSWPWGRASRSSRSGRPPSSRPGTRPADRRPADHRPPPSSRAG